MVIYTTCPTLRSAERLGQRLLAARLIACYNAWPVRSSYRWRGRAGRAREAALVLKTVAARVAALRRALAASHPYETPCLAVVPVRQLNRTYAAWLGESCRPIDRPRRRRYASRAHRR